MPKQSKTNRIHTYRHSNRFTISIVGNIKMPIKLENYNKILLSVNFSNIDFATISLIHSNYKTTFELKQVKYDKAKKILTAESESRRTEVNENVQSDMNKNIQSKINKTKLQKLQNTK
ncbi:3843_t:CDS:1 [Cetraspora pellucida]|uniref:3843_t:CDS:1 n=1 Tax=Cetraspora pellucida TaxID=1433469 RepID=A0A9N9A2B5_9GLOM|nr:3843_t:CDS:1 [Cetraspora pellucida]